MWLPVSFSSFFIAVLQCWKRLFKDPDFYPKPNLGADTDCHCVGWSRSGKDRHMGGELGSIPQWR